MRLRVIFKSGHVEDFDDADYRVINGRLTGIIVAGGEVKVLDPDSVAMVHISSPKKSFLQRVASLL